MTWVTLLTLAVLALSNAASWAATIVAPWGAPDVQPFPPGTPPTDPPLPAGARADATPCVGVGGASFTGSWSSADSTYTIGAIGDVTVDGHTVIRWPSNADSALRAHEAGHDSLNRYEYDQNAQRKARNVMRGLIGSSFRGEGATLAERQADALAKAVVERDRKLAVARASIVRQMNVINAAYDRLTDSGRSPTVNTQQGIAQAIANHYMAPLAGWIPRAPDASRSFCTAYGGSQGLFETPASILAVAGLGLVNEAQLPMDPIVGRGTIRIEPFIVIGAQENGTILLADTYVQVLDSAAGDSLLSGYLAEAAYLPSNVPGYAGMIQAYLVIPPPWAGGIENTIGSPFLAGMEAAGLAGEMTTAWLYSAAPMFDPLGNCVMPPEGVPLTLTLGIASPVSAVPESHLPQRPGLAAWPQPAHGAVRFSWRPVASPLELEIFDLSGARRWAARVDGARGEWSWPGRDADGRVLGAGVYFARLHGAALDLRARVVRVR